MRARARLALSIGLATLHLTGCRLETAPATTHLGPADAGFDALDGAASDATWTEGDHCVVVATTEFRADGGVTVIDAATYAAAVDVTAVHADAVVNIVDDRVFIVNRQGGDSLQELDPEHSYATLSQESVGAGANPWSVIPVGDGTAWVPLYNDGVMQRVDLRAAGTPMGDPIALPTRFDADEKPEPLDGFVYEGILYVLLQGLGDYPRCTPESRGQLLAFDPGSMAPAAVFDGEPVLELAACNPTSWQRVGDQLLIGHSGDHRVSVDSPVDDGGLEIIDLQSGRSRGLVMTESDLGDRDLTHIAADPSAPLGTLWMAIAGDDFSAAVVPVTLEPPIVGAAVWESDLGGVFDLDVALGRVWVVDRTTEAPGVVVLDAENGAHIAGPIDTGFPPFSLALLEREGCNRVVSGR